MTEQYDHFKGKLEEEKTLLERELATVGKKNPDNPGDWMATPAVMDTLKADENEVADTIEEFESNTAILKQLETRYNEVTGALNRIENKSYGTCNVCGKPIEEDRLEANPAATTCKEHLNE